MPADLQKRARELFGISPTRLNDFLTPAPPTSVAGTGKNAYFVFMTRGTITTFSTVLFYLLLVGVMLIIDRAFPGGSCGASGGMLILFCVPWIAAGGLLLSLVSVIRGKEFDKGPAIINGAVLLAILVTLAYARWFS